jgi:hypothetical protein
MSTPRALANQKLYHAKILIEYWRSALAEEQVASRVLRDAFGTAICDHLAGAYGWFLLEVTQPAEMPAKPPRRCAQLQSAAQGKETPPEILEFRQLEAQSWLAQILDPDFSRADHAVSGIHLRSSTNLAIESELEFNPDQAELWHGNLGRLFDRMSDSLDEY